MSVKHVPHVVAMSHSLILLPAALAAAETKKFAKIHDSVTLVVFGDENFRMCNDSIS